MGKFHIGDRVRIKECLETIYLSALQEGSIQIGATGTVIDIQNDDVGCLVKFDKKNEFFNKTDLWVDEDWLELDGLRADAINNGFLNTYDIDIDDLFPENEGKTLTIQFDGENLDVKADDDAELPDLNDKEVAILYNLVESLYELLELN